MCPNCSTTYTADLSAFFYPHFGSIRDAFNDVKLECEDGAVLKANRLILSVFSQFMRDIVNDDPNCESIIVRGVDSATMTNLLAFMHRGTVTLRGQEEVDKFIKAAEDFKMNGFDFRAREEKEEDHDSGKMAAINIEEVEEALGMKRGCDDDKDDDVEEGEISEADTEILDANDDDHDDDDEAPTQLIRNDDDKENGEEKMDVAHDEDDEKEEDDATARLFKEISNSLPVVNLEDLPEKEDKKNLNDSGLVDDDTDEDSDDEEEELVKEVRKALQRLNKKKAAKPPKAKKTIKKSIKKTKSKVRMMRSDLRLARACNARENARRYKLRPRFVCDSGLFVGSTSEDLICPYNSDVAAIAGKIWKCPRPRCGFWSYHRRGLVAHRDNNH